MLVGQELSTFFNLYSTLFILQHELKNININSRPNIYILLYLYYNKLPSCFHAPKRTIYILLYLYYNLTFYNSITL